jgi:hypothetical protein
LGKAVFDPDGVGFPDDSAGVLGGDGMTQFGHALYALNNDIICANSSQAKGRVERANKTLQDHLVKELRLRGISTIAAGNELLPGFCSEEETHRPHPCGNPATALRPRPAAVAERRPGSADEPGKSRE